MRDVLGIVQANRHTADRIAATLLAPDPRFRRTSDGRWTLATPPAETSPVLEACQWAVVDVETTGVRAFHGDRIIEIAVVRLDGTVAFHSLINPGIPVPNFVQGLTGIAPKLLREAPPFEEVVADLLHVFSGCVFVAHNARFDWARGGIAATGAARVHRAARAQAAARSPAPESRHGELSLRDRDRGKAPGHGGRRGRREMFGKAYSAGAGERGDNAR